MLFNYDLSPCTLWIIKILYEQMWVIYAFNVLIHMKFKNFTALYFRRKEEKRWIAVHKQCNRERRGRQQESEKGRNEIVGNMANKLKLKTSQIKNLDDVQCILS